MNTIRHAILWCIKELLQQRFGIGYLLIYRDTETYFEWFDFAAGRTKPKNLPKKLTTRQAYRLVTAGGDQ